MSPPQLLLDENLSERLLPLLIERFPHSTHVRLIGLGGASDTAIWKWASQQVLVLVTKDEDFLDLSVAWGFPPKVVCPAIGNANNAATASLLLQQAETIEQFCSHPDAGFLLLQPFSPAAAIDISDVSQSKTSNGSLRPQAARSTTTAQPLPGA